MHILFGSVKVNRGIDIDSGPDLAYIRLSFAYAEVLLVYVKEELSMHDPVSRLFAL